MKYGSAFVCSVSNHFNDQLAFFLAPNLRFLEMGSGGQPEEGQPTTNNCPTEFYLLTVVCVPATQKNRIGWSKKGHRPTKADRHLQENLIET